MRRKNYCEGPLWISFSRLIQLFFPLSSVRNGEACEDISVSFYLEVLLVLIRSNSAGATNYHELRYSGSSISKLLTQAPAGLLTNIQLDHAYTDIPQCVRN